MRVASMFGTTYKSTMTESTIKENLKKQLPYILNTIRTAGYGPDENG